MGADQPFNATTLERVGAGLRIEPEELTAEAVEDALRRLLDEGSLLDGGAPPAGRDRRHGDGAEVMAILQTRLAAAS